MQNVGKDEVRLYIDDHLPNTAVAEKKVLHVSIGLNGPPPLLLSTGDSRQPWWRRFDCQLGPEALFAALSVACSRREMSPGRELHCIQMRANETSALFAERIKFLASHYIDDEQTTLLIRLGKVKIF